MPEHHKENMQISFPSWQKGIDMQLLRIFLKTLGMMQNQNMIQFQNCTPRADWDHQLVELSISTVT
jgi:hypothetical protein